MRPQLSILFLITFSYSFLFASASRSLQEVEDQPEISIKSATYDEWAEVILLLNPTNIADKVQQVPFVSNLFGIPLTVNGDNAQPEVQASENSLDSAPELIQRNFEAVFFEETGKISQSFETVINSVVTLGIAFHDVLESAASEGIPSNAAPFAALLKKVSTLFTITRDDFRARFPLPVTAPGHAERTKRVDEVLEHLRQLVIRLARDHDIEQEVIERHLTRVKPVLRDVAVFIGDVAELYPSAIEAFVLNISAVILPEAVFLRSLITLYCFGPYVLGKDAIGGWLLKHFSEALSV